MENPNKINQASRNDDVDTKKILTVQAICDRIQDSLMFIALPEGVLKTVTRTGRHMISDPSSQCGMLLYVYTVYASRNSMMVCRDRRIDSCIKLRVNSMAHGKDAKDTWEMTIREQFDGSVDSHVWKILDNEKKYFRE